MGNTNAITCCPQLGTVRWELWLAGKYTLHLKGTAIHHTTEWAHSAKSFLSDLSFQEILEIWAFFFFSYVKSSHTSVLNNVFFSQFY